MNAATEAGRDRLGRPFQPRDSEGRYVPVADLPPCTHCGGSREGKRRGSRGLCSTCYRRWSDHGYPEGGVPAQAPGRGGPGTRDRIADYRVLTRECGFSTAAACLALGLSRRTLQRYEAQLRAQRPRRERAPLTSVAWVNGHLGAATRDLSVIAAANEAARSTEAGVLAGVTRRAA